MKGSCSLKVFPFNIKLFHFRIRGKYIFNIVSQQKKLKNNTKELLNFSYKSLSSIKWRRMATYKFNSWLRFNESYSHKVVHIFSRFKSLIIFRTKIGYMKVYIVRFDLSAFNPFNSYTFCTNLIAHYFIIFILYTKQKTLYCNLVK